MQVRSKSCVVDTFESYIGIKLQKWRWNYLNYVKPEFYHKTFANNVC